MKFLPFYEAKKYVHKLSLKSSQDWNIYCNSGNKPNNIPRNPPSKYKNEWKGWGDWLGTITRTERIFRPFMVARVYAQSLGLTKRQQWFNRSKEGKMPDDIPRNPDYIYRTNWKGWGDWLGTGRIRPADRTFRPFHKARAYVQGLGLKNRKEWSIYSKSKKRPLDIPSLPSRTYRPDWKGWGDWLGTGTIAPQDKDWLRLTFSGKDTQWVGFHTARTFVQKLGLKNREHWKAYCKSGKKPDYIPQYPVEVYRGRWKGWNDWLGHEIIKIKFRTFEESRKYARGLKLASKKEWTMFCKSGRKPRDVPFAPERVYQQWTGWGDWLGTGTIANMRRIFCQFENAREFAQSLQLKSSSEWEEYCLKRQLPKDIPTHPNRTYAKQWKGWGDWLGTLTLKEVVFRPFQNARTYVHTLKFRNRDQFARFCKTKERPRDIPTQPMRTYSKEWKGWGDWLGTNTVATWKREYLPFDEARQFVWSLKLERDEDWRNYIKSGKKPDNIPAAPWNTYKNEWMGIFNWLGYEEKSWSPAKVKDLLKALINSRIIYNWEEAVLYSFLLRKGLLNLHSRHADFFKHFIELTRTQEGLKLIQDYANSNEENPPETAALDGRSPKVEGELEPASSQELATIFDNNDPLDYGQVFTPEDILRQTEVLESINVDEEAIQFYLDYSIDELWKCAFENEHETVGKVKLAGMTGNKYHDTVVDTFLSDYEGSRSIKIPEMYSFPSPPTLMQLYVAYKINNLPYFGNFSATGAGKTLSAILASRLITSRLTIIVCPNDVVEQWKRNILETFHDSKVVTGKDAFFVQYRENEYQFAVLNYDKFSQEDSPNQILNLAKQKIDFVILDEVHFTKIRDEEEISKRRKNLDGLLTAIRRNNSNLKVLGLSATPVVNNLREGRSLLELITGKIYDDVAVRHTIPNAVTLYEKLSAISIRELPKYSIDIDTHIIDVTAQRPPGLSIQHLKGNPLAIEKYLTLARIPEIVKLIDGQTIIYTEYVEDIIQNLSTAVEEAGFTYGLFTGFDRSGLTRFLDNKIQVLIASRPISVGVDGLQRICNRLIINTLPWTNAQYQQLLGRLVRKGHIRDVVHVYLIKASIGGYQYDDLKWKRIQFKRTLADCAVDGRLPEKNLVTPQQAAMEAVRWLERLERGEISTVVRRDLNVELTPVEIKKRVIKYGDFTRLNNKINNENSDTTHGRILKDPKEWDEYHRQYREARKSWPVIPFEEIINRIGQLSPRLLIGDFGCGEAKILEKFGAARVFSFDHVAINNKVTACDIKSVPLSQEAIDIAVFSLSLMGRNWPDYIKEAKRCLATNGYLLIAETTKSMKGRLSKLKEVILQQGFEIFNEEQKGDFTFIEAREV